MIPFPADKIHDEDSALHWWEAVFARACDSLHSQVDAAALVRDVIASIRAIRETSLVEPLDVAAAGGWSDVGTLLRCYQQPDDATMLAVMSHGQRPMEQHKGA